MVKLTGLIKVWNDVLDIASDLQIASNGPRAKKRRRV